jgi:hypothetical protein
MTELQAHNYSVTVLKDTEITEMPKIQKCTFKKSSIARNWWFKLAILATWEADIGSSPA